MSDYGPEIFESTNICVAHFSLGTESALAKHYIYIYIYNSLLVLKYLVVDGTKMSSLLVLRTPGTESALAKHLLAAFTKHAATLLCEHDSDGGPSAADLRRDSAYRIFFLKGARPPHLY
jgi:hypothetical protein